MAMTVKVAVASSGGGGAAARRSEALLFVPAPTSALWQGLLEQFIDANTAAAAIDAICQAVVDESFAIDPFVVVSWSTGRVFVFGDVELTSSMPTMPMISGRGSMTWVEHTAPFDALQLDEAYVVRAGVAVGGPSRLGGGIVPADGIEVTVSGAAGAASAPAAPAVSEAAGDDGDGDGDANDVSSSGWAQLQEAAGDWMEDSVGLPSAPSSADPTAATPLTVPANPVPPNPVLPSPVASNDAPAELQHGSRSEQPVASAVRRSGPPPRPDFDQEITLDPVLHHTDLRSSRASEIHPAAGAVVLPDGRRLAVTGSLVLGRQPDLAAARVAAGDAIACALDVGNEVSRTHLVIRSTGGVAEVIDCASSSRTVLLSDGVAEPLALDPWVPYELADGDVLYLGGPTQVRFER